MTKEYLLKRIVESKEFHDKYWPELEIKDDCRDYGPYISKGNNPYLKSLKTVVYNEAETDKNMKKIILNQFKL